MSRSVELPEPVYRALEQAAAARGMTPAAWIAAHLPPEVPTPAVSRPGTLAERMAPYLGVVDSGIGNLSDNTGAKFADGMEEKRRTGRL
jgi:hypothetical protein